MKKQISLFLVLLLCLTLFGCGGGAPTGELDILSLPVEEALASSPSIVPEGSDETEAIVSEGSNETETVVPEDAASSAAGTNAQTQAAAPPAAPGEDVPPAPESLASSPKPESAPKKTTVTHVVAFSPPPEQTVFTHNEDTRDGFIAWLNSEEAMTEQNGAFRDIVNLYRRHGSAPLASLPDNDTDYSLYSNGQLFVLFNNSGFVITPIDETKAAAAQNGIVSYFTAKGNTVLPNVAQFSNFPVERASNEQWSMIVSDERRTSIQFAACAPAVGGRTVDAVYEIRRDEISMDYGGHYGEVKIIYSRRLHWLEDGFHVTYAYTDVTTMEEALVMDELRLSQLRIENAALTAAPTVVSTPLETQ